MKLLLDTHIWMWSVADVALPADRVRRALEDPSNELWICSIGVWEVLILSERGAADAGSRARNWVRDALADPPLREAPVTIDVAAANRAVRLQNQDPADRFIAGSATARRCSV